MPSKSKNFVDTPMKDFLPSKAGYKGGPGEYNGEKGQFAKHGRTPSPNAVPEKTKEGAKFTKPSD